LKCSSSSFELKTGFRLTLLKIPTGSLINSLSLNMNEQVKYIRSAGTFGQLVQKNLYLSKIRLPSGKILTLSSLNYATIGIISNKIIAIN
jgi:large subunit ribosomal protein L2